MTNEEKFVEIFGFDPDISTGPVACKAHCDDCVYYRKGEKIQCRSQDWWDEEYKECKNGQNG